VIDQLASRPAEEKGAMFANALRLLLPRLKSWNRLTPENQQKSSDAVERWGKQVAVEGEQRVGSFVPPRRRAERVQELPKDFDPEAPASFRPYLTGDKKIKVGESPAELFALVVIPSDAKDWSEGSRHVGIDFWCATLTDDSLKTTIERSITREIREAAYAKRSLSKEDLDLIQRTDVSLTGKDPKKAAGKEKVGIEDTMRQWAPVAAVYLLWVAIFTVAQMLLNNTTEEKSNRVIEVLLSSVTPVELMFGKLVGIACVGLTMVGAWIASFLLLIHYASGLEASLARALMDTVATPQLLVAFAGYFVLGYLLYAGVFLAIGSVVTSLKEAQNLMGPIMIIMIVPLMTMVFIARDPNGTLAEILSWIPLYTPFVMMNRAAASPPAVDIYGTLVLLVISVGLSIWVSGKIFRIGVLRTGQPPKLLELLGWIRGK
jgi:ABC-2 type transport system permease protein